MRTDAQLAAEARRRLESLVLDGDGTLAPAEARILFASLVELAMLDTPA